MKITKVVGQAISTLNNDKLKGMKILIVQNVNAKTELTGDPFIAVDLVGAGDGEYVIVAQGSTARIAVGSGNAPVDAAIVGILDSLSSDGKTTLFEK